jgi:hypothetical protein
MALLVSLVLVTFGVALPIPLLALELSPLWTASARAAFFLGAAALNVCF